MKVCIAIRLQLHPLMLNELYILSVAGILTLEERLINTFNLALQPDSVVEPPPGIVLPPLPLAGIVTNYRFSNLTKRQAPSSPQYCSSTRVCEGISTSHRCEWKVYV